MKKKILSALITIIALCTCAFTLTACGGVEFKVNFVVDGAVYATIDTSGQEIIKMPENPTKEGYTFDGWYWDKDTWQTPFTANSLLDAPLSSDMNVYAKWKANVVNVESINLNKTEITLHENDVEYLTATILPANATDTSVVWESSNSTIATVVGGKVTALRVGNVTISAITNDGGKIATCNVYVEPILVESVNLNYTSLSLLNGESKTLTATVLPNNATEKGVNWSSSNSSIVTVENGVIKAVGYGSATITVSTIDGNKTATCVVEVVEDKITFNTLSVEDETVYGKVSNSTATFSFIKEIVEHGNATYKVYKEITCETEINSKSISLKVGDNTVYILQTVGRDLKLYIVTVRRRPMYEVTFNSNGGTSVSSQTVEEDSFATEPTTTRIGYTFNGWDFDFNTPITQSITIKANWRANTNTPYKVEYYLQNLENDNYTKQETVNKTGTTNTIAKAEIKTFAHFTHKATSTDSGNIAPNGLTVLKVYYTRDKYIVTFNGNGGTLVSGNASQTVKYGGGVIAPTFKKTGYTFIGYDKTNYTNISENFTVTAKWKINQYTLTVVYDNGQENKIATQEYSSKIEKIETPTRDGYIFNGWDKEMPSTMPAENLTITATWQSTFTLSGNTITGLTSYGKNNCTELIIPSMIDGVSITSIDNYAFSGCYNLTSVEIGDSVTSIGNYAFYDCSSLTSIVIPDNVNTIGERAFYNCSSLTSIEIGDSVTSIGIGAFYNCSSLTSVVIGDSVTSIGDSAFCNCSSLTSVVIGDSVTNIGDYAFCNCSSLTSVVIGDSVTSIGALGFYGCRLLTSVEIGDSVTSIGYEAFYDCSLLTSVVIGDSVKRIGNYAFCKCSSLTSVVIGDSVKSIGDGAFKNCSSLTRIKYRGTVSQWQAITKSDSWNYNTGNYTITYNYTGN